MCGFALDDTRVLEGGPLGSFTGTAARAVTMLLRPNALFLSTAAAANHATLLPLYAWFERNLLLAEADSRPFRQALTTQLLDDPGTRESVLAFLRAADLGITGATMIEPDPAVRERVQRAVRILAGQEDDNDGPESGTSRPLG